VAYGAGAFPVVGPPPVSGVLLAVAVAGSSAASATETPAGAQRRPNVILVLTDDQGYGDLSCHGNPILRTPNIDRFYAEAVRFTDFHVSPLCTPTRAALLTGRDPGKVGAYRTSAGRMMLHRGERTIADLFAANGYATGMFGKWHLGDHAPHRPQDRGFQDVVWHRCGAIGHVSDVWGNDYFDDIYERNGRLEQFQGYCTDVWFREALRFVEENRDRPFFLYLPLNAPHTPLNVEEKWAAPYEDKVPWPALARYYGMIANIDDDFGRFRQRIRELGLEENTILIFMTDNGTYSGARFADNDSLPIAGFNAGMRGRKASIFDGGHRVPFFIRWPAGGIGGGWDVDRLAVHLDVLPTLDELCGIRVDADWGLDGQSLVPLLRREPSRWTRSQVVLQFHGGVTFERDREKWAFAYIMTDRWRLLHGRELYDIQNDPEQQTDLADAYPDVVTALREAYEPYWQAVLPGFEPVRMDIGNPTENPVELSSHSWYTDHGNPPWNFRMIEKLPRVTAPWMLSVVRAGRYRLTLRQYPKRAEKPVRAVRARIRIGDIEAEQAVEAESMGVVFEVDLPVGPTELTTWLYDEKGEAGGAYFTEVEYLGNAGS